MEARQGDECPPKGEEEVEEEVEVEQGEDEDEAYGTDGTDDTIRGPPAPIAFVRREAIFYHERPHVGMSDLLKGRWPKEDVWTWYNCYVDECVEPRYPTWCMVSGYGAPQGKKTHICFIHFKEVLASALQADHGLKEYQGWYGTCDRPIDIKSNGDWRHAGYVCEAAGCKSSGVPWTDPRSGLSDALCDLHAEEWLEGGDREERGQGDGPDRKTSLYVYVEGIRTSQGAEREAAVQELASEFCGGASLILPCIRRKLTRQDEYCPRCTLYSQDPPRCINETKPGIRCKEQSTSPTTGMCSSCEKSFRTNGKCLLSLWRANHISCAPPVRTLGLCERGVKKWLKQNVMGGGAEYFCQTHPSSGDGADAHTLPLWKCFAPSPTEDSHLASGVTATQRGGGGQSSICSFDFCHALVCSDPLYRSEIPLDIPARLM